MLPATACASYFPTSTAGRSGRSHRSSSLARRSSRCLPILARSTSTRSTTPGWVAANINQIITNLEKGDVAWMATTGNERRVSKGEVLITAGEPVEALLIVLDGELSVMLDTDETVARLTAGDIVGEMSLIEDRPPTVSVMCSTDARVLAIPFSEIRRRLDSDTAFASRFHQAFAVFLSHRLRATMARLGYGSSEDDGQASVGAQNAPGGGQRSP